tara:strand:+ start:4074 stop:4250 length:177 start_codon:yes stop_codon:yes gene_type:complete
LQEVITVVGLPMFILVFIIMFVLYSDLSHEDFREVRVGKPTQAVRAETGRVGGAQLYP